MKLEILGANTQNCQIKLDDNLITNCTKLDFSLDPRIQYPIVNMGLFIPEDSNIKFDEVNCLITINNKIYKLEEVKEK